MLSGLKTRFFKVFAAYCSIRTERRRNLRFAQNCREDSCASNALVQIKNPPCLLSLARLFCKDLPGTPPQTCPKIFLLIYVYVPRSSLPNSENRRSLAICVLELFNSQSRALYFETDSSNTAYISDKDLNLLLVNLANNEGWPWSIIPSVFSVIF